MKNFYHDFSIMQQVKFKPIALFHESQEFSRFYQLPFNMLSITLRSEGEDASIVTNLKTGEVRKSRENMIALVPCNLPQFYQHTLRSERLCIHFQLELFPGVDIYSNCNRCFKEYSPALRQEAWEIFQISDPILRLSRCTEFALRFCHRHWPETYPVNFEKIHQYENMLHTISANISGTTRVKDMAELLHYSFRNFDREFQKLFNMSPKTYLQRELMSRAAAYLANPAENVKSVAEKLRFVNEFHFSRFFKKMTGFPPSQYHKMTSKYISIPEEKKKNERKQT